MKKEIAVLCTTALMLLAGCTSTKPETKNTEPEKVIAPGVIVEDADPIEATTSEETPLGADESISDETVESTNTSDTPSAETETSVENTETQATTEESTNQESAVESESAEPVIQN